MPVINRIRLWRYMNSKNILRNKVRAYLLSQIKAGVLKIGNSINLAKLARDLNVSVTPVREALSQLEQARIIKAIPNRGFIIPKLSYTEARDLYEIIAQLEIMALESTNFKENTIEELKKEQRRLQQTHTSSARLQSRIAFHHLLVRDCANITLLHLLQDLEARILFYEQLYITDASFYEQVDNQNEAIIRAIEEDNIPTAALILKMNWVTVSEHIKNKIIRNQTVGHLTIES